MRAFPTTVPRFNELYLDQPLLYYTRMRNIFCHLTVAPAISLRLSCCILFSVFDVDNE